MDWLWKLRFHIFTIGSVLERSEVIPHTKLVSIYHVFLTGYCKQLETSF